MRYASRELALGHLAVQAQTVRVVRALDHADVDCILLKGVGHDLWLYPDGARPVSRDVDVLIPPDQAELACRIVSELGMKPARDLVGPREQGVELRFVAANGSGVPIELHPSFQLVRAPPERCWKVLSTEPEQIELGGMKIHVPALPARAALLALHVAAHGRVADWAIEDLRRALGVVSLDDWQRAAGVAEELDAAPAFSSGLRFLPAGRKVADALGLINRDDPTLLLHARSANEPAFKMLEYVDQSPLKGFARLLRKELIPPAQQMRTWYPLARRGRSGLLAAHLARLSRLGLTTPQLLVKWRQARTATRQAAR